MKILGTDVSIETCKAEGYLMIQFDARKKFNPDTDYRIFAYYPEYYEGLSGQLVIDTSLTFNDLVKLYNDDKDSINSFAETDKHVNFESPDYWDFLNLASDINSYKGLD